jgi:CrcB protein
MSLVIYAAVDAGGAFWATLRYSVSLLTGAGFFGINGPLATLSVNVVGSGVMGLLAGLVAGGLILPEAWRAFFAVGLLGTLTTFSSFPLDAGNLVHKQGLDIAILYAGLCLCLSLGSFALCYLLVSMPL